MSKELNAELSSLVKDAYEALKKAQEFAEKHDLEFSFSPSYGMGGWFRKVDADDVEYHYRDSEDVGSFDWFPSSQSC